VRIPEEEWKEMVRQEEIEQQPIRAEIRAIDRRRRAQRRAWWWNEHWKLVAGLIAFAVATVALGILLKVW